MSTQNSSQGFRSCVVVLFKTCVMIIDIPFYKIRDGELIKRDGMEIYPVSGAKCPRVKYGNLS